MDTVGTAKFIRHGFHVSLYQFKRQSPRDGVYIVRPVNFRKYSRNIVSKKSRISKRFESSRHLDNFKDFSRAYLVLHFTIIFMTKNGQILLGTLTHFCYFCHKFFIYGSYGSLIFTHDKVFKRIILRNQT